MSTGRNHVAKPFTRASLRRLRDGLGNKGVDKDTALRMVAQIEMFLDESHTLNWVISNLERTDSERFPGSIKELRAMAKRRSGR